MHRFHEGQYHIQNEWGVEKPEGGPCNDNNREYPASEALPKANPLGKLGPLNRYTNALKYEISCW